MKTRLLIIIGIIFSSGIVIVNVYVYAMPYISTESNFENSKYVLVGKILSVEILSQPVVQKDENMYSEHHGFALYEIEVENYLKNPISNSTIHILGQYTNEKPSMTYVTKPYEVEQTVLLYLQEENYVPGYDLMIRSSGSQVIDDVDNLTCKEIGCSVMIVTKPTDDVNYVDFRDADGNIIEVGCSIGERAPEYRYFGDGFLDSLKCNPTVTLIPIFVLIGIIIAVIFIIKRKRK